MPYLPPEIVDPDTPITCALVFFPDAEEYRRALLGQIAELSDVWNWEDSRVNQAIIRQLWLEAESQTLECDNMACLDDLIAYIDNVEPLLESIRDKPCCPQVTTAPPGTEEVGGVDDSTAPPGDQDIAAEIIPPEFEDVDEYQQYLCGAANRIADATDGAVDAIYDTILLASNVVVFATLVVLAFGNVIGMGIAAVLAGGYTLVTFSEVFGFFSVFTELREALDGDDPGGIVPATKAELAAAHDDIVSAIACANTPQEAAAALADIADATISDTRYRAMYKIMFNSLVMRAIWAGYMLDVTPSTDCDCIPSLAIGFVGMTETFLDRTGDAVSCNIEHHPSGETGSIFNSSSGHNWTDCEAHVISDESDRLDDFTCGWESASLVDSPLNSNWVVAFDDWQGTNPRTGTVTLRVDAILIDDIWVNVVTVDVTNELGCSVEVDGNVVTLTKTGPTGDDCRVTLWPKIL